MGDERAKLDKAAPSRADIVAREQQMFVKSGINIAPDAKQSAFRGEAQRLS